MEEETKGVLDDQIQNNLRIQERTLEFQLDSKLFELQLKTARKNFEIQLNSDFLEIQAKICFKLYNELKKVGFNSQQAVEITSNLYAGK